MYVIAWKSKITGKTGQGTAKFSKAEADRIVEEANRQYPDLYHWAKAVN